MNTEKNTVTMIWDGSNLDVSRTRGDKIVEIREFSAEQYPRASELFVELATDKCGAAFRAPHPTRAQSDEAGETAAALVEAVGLLVRVINDGRLKNNELVDDIEEFVERMAGQEGDDD